MRSDRTIARPTQPLQPTHSAVTRLACATRAPAGGRLNGGVSQTERRHPWLVALAIILAAGAGVALGGDPSAGQSCGKPCREHPKLVGPCFKAHGRMSIYNGNPTYRIWPVGTKRLLGVSLGVYLLPGYCNLPPAIEGKLSLGSDLFADFVVCPFEASEAGHMQLVCVESASNEVVSPKARHH